LSILLDKNTKTLVSGITGRVGRVQCEYMREYGTNVVAGVTPGRGGQEVDGVPVFDLCAEAAAETGAEAAVFFVPPPFLKDAMIEALDAGLRLLVAITEFVPVRDTMEAVAFARRHRPQAIIIGPNTQGMITPGQAKLGVIPANCFAPGRVGLISRSGSLMCELGGDLMAAGLGCSTAVGMGADPVIGTSLTDLVKMFQEDPATDVVVTLGEVGGRQEEALAELVAAGEITVPLVSFVAGKNVPQGRRMGHHGAVVKGRLREGDAPPPNTAEAKIATLSAAGIRVAEQPCEIPELIKSMA